MYGKSRPGEQSLVADVTLEVFGLLVLHQDLLIIKLSIAIPKFTASLRNTSTMFMNAASLNHLLFSSMRAGDS